jgi:hypothetical protein
MDETEKPVILDTGATGFIGSFLIKEFDRDVNCWRSSVTRQVAWQIVYARECISLNGIPTIGFLKTRRLKGT